MKYDLFVIFKKSGKILNCCVLQIIGGTSWFNSEQVQGCFRMETTVFKMFIWGDMSSDIWFEITFKGFAHAPG